MQIYKTTNLITNEFYIGMHKYKNTSYLGSGTKILAQLKKYGKHNFKKEILCTLNDSDNYEMLRKIENLFIEEYFNNSKCLNISKGSKGNIKKQSTKLIEKVIYKDKVIYKYKPSNNLSKLLYKDYDKKILY